MLNEERALHFFVAGFDRLPLVVMLEPHEQGWAEAILAIMDQDRIFIRASDFKTLQGSGQRVGTAMQLILPPAQHLGVVADLDPARVAWQLGAQGGGRLAV